MSKDDAETILFLAKELSKLGITKFQKGDLALEFSRRVVVDNQAPEVVTEKDPDDEEALYWSS